MSKHEYGKIIIAGVKIIIRSKSARSIVAETIVNLGKSKFSKDK
ncbi:MAG: hypothetical protein QFX12_01835 [Rickettsia africae]|nr:hypothetical protein [Rickettsia africae]